jgi:hypothetical protein
MNNVVCSHPDKQMVEGSTDGLQMTEKMDAGRSEPVEETPDTLHPMPPPGAKPTTHSRKITEPLPAVVPPRKGTSAAHTPGKSEEKAQANDDLTAKKNDTSGFGEKKHESDSMKEEENVHAAREFVRNNDQIRKLLTEMLRILEQKYGLKPAVGQVFRSPLSLHPHAAKAAPAIKSHQLLDMKNAQLMPLTAENIMLKDTIPIGMFAVPSLMQGTATGTKQFKDCIKSWEKAKHVAIDLTGSDDESLSLAGNLLVGAFGKFLIGAEKFYRAILANNRSTGMSISSHTNIVKWIDGMQVCINNYYPQFLSDQEIAALRREIDYTIESTHVQEEYKKPEAAATSNDDTDE